MDRSFVQRPNSQYSFFCLTHARRSHSLLLAVIVGFAMLWFLFPLCFWNGQGGFFEKIDTSQHIAGWQFYVQDDWRFPLLKTNRVNSPEGVNIAFMDSIPLAALLLKPFARWLPEHFHYIAIWHVFVFLGQAIAASVLVRSLGARSLFATFAACLFACLWPALMWRFGHTALMTQSLLLFALALYFQKKRGIMPVFRAQSWLLLLSVIGLLIHPYFFAMLFSFYIFSLLEETITHGDWRTSTLFFSLSLMIFAVLLTVFGYFGQQTTSFGFGEYSMNLSSPFCGSHFYSCVDSEDHHQFASYHFADPTKGQYEGLNYLGLGFFLLLPVSVYAVRSRLAEIFQKYKWFLLFLLALTVYACANRIYWNEHLLFEYSVPQWLTPITNTFRSSGRFFWLAGYTLLFVSLAAVMQSLNKRKIALVVLALALQFVDTRDFSQRLTRIASEPAKGDLVAWAPVMEKLDNIHVYPAFPCASGNDSMVWFFQRLAAHYQKRIDTGYIARAQVDCQQNRQYFEQTFVPRSLYVMPIKDRLYAPDGFIEAAQQQACVLWDEYLVCAPGLTRSVFLSQSIGTEFQGALNEISWAGKDLLTQVGVATDVLRSAGQAGFLNYGPYVQLISGHYEFLLEYQGDLSTAVEQASWDVWATLPEEEAGGLRLSSGILFGTANEKRIVRVPVLIDSKTENRLLEFRSVFNGQGQLTITALSLKKLSD